MPWKRHNPGCPCCDGWVCTYLDEDFSGGQLPSELTIVDGSWSVSSGELTTSDANALIRTTDAVTYDYHQIEFKIPSSNSGTRIDVIVGWDRNYGEYLFARIDIGGSCGTITLYEHDGYADNIIEGPWTIVGLKTSQPAYGYATVTVRYHTDSGRTWLSAVVETRDTDDWTTDFTDYPLYDDYRMHIDVDSRDFTINPGKFLGLRTGAAGTYTFDDLEITNLESGCPEYVFCDRPNWHPHTYGENPVLGVVQLSEFETCRFTLTDWSSGNDEVITSTQAGSLLVLNDTFVSTTTPRTFLFTWQSISPNHDMQFQFWYLDASNYWYVRFYDLLSGNFVAELVEVSGGTPTTHLAWDDLLCVGAEWYPTSISLAFNRIRLASASGVHQHIVDAPTSPWEMRVVANGGAAPLQVNLTGYYISCGELAFRRDKVTIVVSGLTYDCDLGNGTYVMEVVDYYESPFTWEVYSPAAPFTKVKFTLSISGACDYLFEFELEWTDPVHGAQTANFRKAITDASTCRYPHLCGRSMGDGLDPFLLLGSTPLEPYGGYTCIEGQAVVL